LKDLTKIIYGNERVYRVIKGSEEAFDQHPELTNDADYYN